MALSGEGSIELIMGPMFSEKTSELISRVRRESYANKKSIIVKWKGDNRYEDGNIIATHSGWRQSSTDDSMTNASIRVVSVDLLGAVVVSPDESIIGIDEGQFYPDLIEMCTRWAAMGLRVIVAALDGDFNRQPFGQTCALIPLCENVEKRHGICMKCRNNKSSFTQRLVFFNDLILIGSSESYRTVCRKCYDAPLIQGPQSTCGK